MSSSDEEYVDEDYDDEEEVQDPGFDESTYYTPMENASIMVVFAHMPMIYCVVDCDRLFVADVCRNLMTGDLSDDKNEELVELDDDVPEIEEFDDDDDDDDDEPKKEWTEQFSDLETKATELAAEGDMSAAAETLTTLTQQLANRVVEDQEDEEKIAEYKIFVMSLVSLWSEVLESLEDDDKATLADDLRGWFDVFVDNDILARPERRAHETDKDKQLYVKDFFEQLENLDAPAKKKSRKV